MNEQVLEKVLATVERIYFKTNTPVSLSDIGQNGVIYCGNKLSAKERREALTELTRRGLTKIVRTHRGTLAYAPEDQKSDTESNKPSTADLVYEAVKQGLMNIQYFSGEPTPGDILNFMRTGFQYGALWFFKKHVLTRDGAIARQIAERVHFEFFIGNHRSEPISKRYALVSNEHDVIKSTLAERKAALQCLIKNGFIRLKGVRLVPVTPYPSWDTYKKHKEN